MSLTTLSLKAQTRIDSLVARYQRKVDDSITNRTGNKVITPYNVGNRYKDLANVLDSFYLNGVPTLDQVLTSGNVSNNKSIFIRASTGYLQTSFSPSSWAVVSSDSLSRTAISGGTITFSKAATAGGSFQGSTLTSGATSSSSRAWTLPNSTGTIMLRDSVISIPDADYTVLHDNVWINISSWTSPRTLFFPSAATYAGGEIKISSYCAACSGTMTGAVNNAGSPVALGAFENVTLKSNGTDWIVYLQY